MCYIYRDPFQRGRRAHSQEKILCMAITKSVTLVTYKDTDITFAVSMHGEWLTNCYG